MQPDGYARINCNSTAVYQKLNQPISDPLTTYVWNDFCNKHILLVSQSQTAVSVITPHINESIFVHRDSVLITTGEIRQFLAFKTFDQDLKSNEKFVVEMI